MVINIYTTLNEVRSQDGADGNPTANYSEMKKYAPLHPSTRSWEVARGNITIEKIIGKGASGQVAQGKAINLHGREESITVAIKMLKGTTLIVQITFLCGYCLSLTGNLSLVSGNATDTEGKDLLQSLKS